MQRLADNSPLKKQLDGYFSSGIENIKLANIDLRQLAPENVGEATLPGHPPVKRRLAALKADLALSARLVAFVAASAGLALPG